MVRQMKLNQLISPKATRRTKSMRSIYVVCQATLLALIVLTMANSASAQTGAFTYQGRLTDGGMPANGTYDLQFTLWDTLTSGNQLPDGSPLTVTKSGVQVPHGVVTVQLDCTAAAFPGADRFLEISVKHPADSSYTTLQPRIQLTSTPYAIRSATAASADTATNATNATSATNATNAAQLGGVAANQYVLINDSRLSDARTPTAGSSNYIQNGTSQQTGSNFNISGDGTAGGTLNGNVVSATTKYNIGTNRVLGLGDRSTFVGLNTGAAITSGVQNTFLGQDAGAGTTQGQTNSFVGYEAGKGNATGSNNVYVGTDAGLSATNGLRNTFIGAISGKFASGTDNAFFGAGTGGAATTGSFNTLIGSGAGANVSTENNNTLIGAGTGINVGVTGSTAIG